MKRNKKRNIVLSLLIAIALWSFVIYTTDPVRSMIIKDVPVEITGQEVLEEKNLTVVDPEDVKIDVTVKGARSVLSSFSENDIHITADATEAVAGDNYLPITIKLDKDVQTSSDIARTIHVQVENVVNEARKIKIEYDDSVEEIAAEVTSADIVHVKGPESKVKTVAYVSARLNESDISSGQSDVTKKIVPVDVEGNEVSGVELDVMEVSIHLEGFDTKSLPLNVKVIGAPANGYELVSAEMPDKVVVSGSKDVLNAMSEVRGNTINIDGLYETTTVDLEISLPDGIVPVAGQKLTATIRIAPVSSDEVTSVDISDIMFAGLTDEYSAQTEDNVTVTGKGIVQSRISVIADVSNLDEGTHKVKVKAKSSDGEKVSVSPKYIIVTISRE